VFYLQQLATLCDSSLRCHQLLYPNRHFQLVVGSKRRAVYNSVERSTDSEVQSGVSDCSEGSDRRL